MRKYRIYVETSVWGMLVNEDPKVFRKAAERFLFVEEDYDLFVSSLVLEEIEMAHSSIVKIIRKTLSLTNPGTLPDTTEVRELANYYVNEREIVSPKYRNDALHVAYASVNDMDYLVSFNFKHIVAENKRHLFTAANLIKGYPTPKIIWPGEIGDVSDEL